MRLTGRCCTPPEPARRAKLGVPRSVKRLAKDRLSSKSSRSGIRGASKDSMASSSLWLLLKDIVKELEMDTNVGRWNVSVLCLFVVEMAGMSERFGPLKTGDEMLII